MGRQTRMLLEPRTAPDRVATPCNARKSPGSYGIKALCYFSSGRFPNTWKRRTEVSTRLVNQLYIHNQYHATETAVAPICTDRDRHLPQSWVFTWKRRTEVSTRLVNQL